MEQKNRPILKIIHPLSVMEGAGVRLKRSFPTTALDFPDPFLLFDHFGSENPDDYLAGFPMHPHRGIETVTYMLAGEVSHRDSLGNAGTIGAGDVQWMTAGRGILHEEMPKPIQGQMEGFQLWVNLPSQLKMTHPRYQEIASTSIPEVSLPEGVTIRVIAGSVEGASGPVTDIAAEPSYLDIHLQPHSNFSRQVENDHTVLAYLYRGQAAFGKYDERRDATISAPALIVLDEGNWVSVQSAGEAARFLLMSGKPMHEPIVRYGPFVMNTQAEIVQTLKDLRNGTFGVS